MTRFTAPFMLTVALTLLLSGVAIAVQQEQEKEGVLVQLQGCKLNGKSVQCQFVMTSLSRDRTVGFYYNETVAYDNIGDEYRVADAKIGRGSAKTRLFVEGVPTPVSLRFDNVSSDASALALVKVVLNINNKRAEFQYRDVPLGSP